VGVVVVIDRTDDERRANRQVAGQQGGQQGDPPAATPPYPKPVKAAELLENVAWAAARRPWVEPRPDQFMYIETIFMQNRKGVQDDQSNGALVPGQTQQTRRETWWRLDFKASGIRENGGRLDAYTDDHRTQSATLPYSDVAGLDTPEKFEAWHAADKSVSLDTDALLATYVLPPAVEAAIFRWLARQPGVQVDLNSVNLDGRPAIALTFRLEGYLKHDMLFDPQTYALIGRRLVAYADHTDMPLDGPRHIKAGDVFALDIYGKRGIVDKVGGTP
jgi:hypothetical protein